MSDPHDVKLPAKIPKTLPRGKAHIYSPFSDCLQEVSTMPATALSVSFPGHCTLQTFHISTINLLDNAKEETSSSSFIELVTTKEEV
jgi:hypothetical protein